MGRKRTGCAQWDPDRKIWVAMITIGEPGHTKRRPIGMPEIAEQDEDGAHAFARVISERAEAGGAVEAGTGETVIEWWKRYHDAAERGEVGRKNKGRPQISVGARRARFRDFIAKFIGTIPMAEVRPEDVHRVVTALNARVRERGDFYTWPEKKRAEHKGPKPGISPKQAAHVWSEMRTGFREACRLGNVPGLKLRDDDPTDKVEPPTSGTSRDMAALYPSELTKLLACADIPLFRRATYTVAAYTGIRLSELRALRKCDVDLEHGLIRVGEQMKTNKAKRSRTKTEAAVRHVPIHSNLQPFLKALLEGLSDDDRILRIPAPEDCAEKLRGDLEQAGLTRPELSEDSASMQPFSFHGLRHTCLTHWAMSKGANAWTLAAAGHTDVQTSQRYVAKANLLQAGRFGEPHPALPKCLFESSGYRLFVHPGFLKSRKNKLNLVIPMGIEPMFPT